MPPTTGHTPLSRCLQRICLRVRMRPQSFFGCFARCIAVYIRARNKCLLRCFPPPPSQKITFARPTFNVPSLDSLVQTSLSLFLSFSYIYSSIIVNNRGLFKVRCRKSGFVIRSSRFKCVPFKKESC